MRFRHSLVPPLLAVAASGVLVVAVSPAGAQEPTAPPGGRGAAPTVAPGAAPLGTAPVNAGVFGTAVAGTAVAGTAVAGTAVAGTAVAGTAVGGGADPTAAPSSAAEATAARDQATGTRSADAESERRVRRIVLGLLAIAVVMAAATIAFWQATKPVSPELDRLSRMGSRGFRNARPYERTEILGASPLTRLEQLGGRPVNGEPAAGPAAAAVAGSSAATGAAAEPPVPAARESDPSIVEPGAPGAESDVSVAAVAERDGSVVVPDPARALERPVIAAPDDAIDVVPEDDAAADVFPDESLAGAPVAPAGTDDGPGTDDDRPPTTSSAEDSDPDRAPSAGPVTS
jgi:hypothetical protein